MEVLEISFLQKITALCAYNVKYLILHFYNFELIYQ